MIESCFSETKAGQIWKDYMARIINEENEQDYNVEDMQYKIQ